MKTSTAAFQANTDSVTCLNLSHLEAVQRLDSIVYDSLSEEQKPFIVLKSEETLRKYLQQEGGLILGIFNQEAETPQLHGISYLIFPTAQENTGLEAYTIPEDKLTQSATVMGVKTHPYARRKGYMGTLLAACEDWAIERNRPYLYTEIATANQASINGFKKANYEFLHKDTVIENEQPLSLSYYQRFFNV